MVDFDTSLSDSERVESRAIFVISRLDEVPGWVLPGGPFCFGSFSATFGWSNWESPISWISCQAITARADPARAEQVPDFVKMDVEGAELEIIESALPWIRNHQIRFAIASYHRRNGHSTVGRLEQMFRSIGYEAETGFPDHLTTWAWKA